MRQHVIRRTPPRYLFERRARVLKIREHELFREHFTACAGRALSARQRLVGALDERRVTNVGDRWRIYGAFEIERMSNRETKHIEPGARSR